MLRSGWIVIGLGADQKSMPPPPGIAGAGLCFFGTFAGREWVAEDVVWAKLSSLRKGADIASERLWGKKSH